MSLCSMTGYGVASRPWDSPTGQARLDVEVRSVNARFLELKIRQPFGPKVERKIRAQAEARVGRGRVELGVFIRRGAGQGEEGDLLDQWGLGPARIREALRAAAAVVELSVEENVSLQRPNALEVLRFLQSMTARTPDVPTEPPQFLGALVDEALEEMCAFRRREGEALTSVLGSLLGELRAQMGELRERLPEESDRILAKLTERVGDVCARAGVPPPDPERLAQEVVVLVARGDVDEELARIESHLAQADGVLTDAPKKGQGKTMDFLSQELLREVTTIGSKITSHEGSRIVIAAKGTIERIREQVQNVE